MLTLLFKNWRHLLKKTQTSLHNIANTTLDFFIKFKEWYSMANTNYCEQDIVKNTIANGPDLVQVGLS